MWSSPWIIYAILSTPVRAEEVLRTDGFKSCQDDSPINVQRLDISFDRGSNALTFNVAGSNSEEQNVTAKLSVQAYGKEVFSKDFNPCDDATKVDQLCPVPSGTFSADGSQEIPSQYQNQIPAIAFDVPDLEGVAKLELKALDGGQPVACIESGVVNGKTAHVPAVSYVAAGIAGCALLLSGFSALGSAGAVGGHAPAPGFGTVVVWFQGIAMNGMLSVDYPPVYQHFSRNFAFAGGLVSWNVMQTSIDNFRKATGGNLTYNNASEIAQAMKTQGPLNSKRGLDLNFADVGSFLVSRNTAANLSAKNDNTSTNRTKSGSEVSPYVQGIQGYVEQLSIPQANTFITVLLVLAIVITAIALGILLFKVILEFWALFGSFPKKLTGFRKRYWGLLGRTITNLVLLLYGVWTLYCIFQFTNGDSWAAKALAGITLSIFTILLAAFTFKIWHLAHKYKKVKGDTAALFEDKETWRRYSLFYDSYKRGYWWMFLPSIVYMFTKGCVIAAANGHGLTQTAGQLIVESLMLILVLWSRPFVSKDSNWINIIIQIVRVLSVACILVFVQELGISQSTKTITGVVLVAVQGGLTGLLAILIAVNAIIVCFRENPHRKQRKAAEKRSRDLDNLTSLEPRNTLLIDDDMSEKRAIMHTIPLSNEPLTPMPAFHSRRSFHGSREALLDNTGPMGLTAYGHGRSTSRQSSRAPSRNGGRMSRQPTNPNFAGEYSNESRNTSRDSVRMSRQPTIPNVGVSILMEETAQQHQKAGSRAGGSDRSSTTPSVLLPGRAV